MYATMCCAMYQVIQDIGFCYGHRLLDYAGKCSSVHGHNAVASIVLGASELTRSGMVIDFDDVQASVGTWLRDTIDHKLLLRRDDPLVPVLRDMNELFVPMDANPTAENIARMIYDRLKQESFPVVEVRLCEVAGSVAIYAGG